MYGMLKYPGFFFLFFFHYCYFRKVKGFIFKGADQLESMRTAGAQHLWKSRLRTAGICGKLLWEAWAKCMNKCRPSTYGFLQLLSFIEISFAENIITIFFCNAWSDLYSWVGGRVQFVHCTTINMAVWACFCQLNSFVFINSWCHYTTIGPVELICPCKLGIV